uniref:Uncharacterized protein n=1 Tax=Tanacetum cinerariifolium TaxID=118510 RepID=A0A6L2KZR2_TANCI|nr:hypothetical protein [Tanacetum cinerariifolium]
MAFISSAKHSRGNEEVNTVSVSTASTNIPTASANIRVIDEDDMEEMDMKWNMALLSTRADRAPRSQDRERRDNYKQGSKVEEQAPKALMAIDGVGWDWRLAQVETRLTEHIDQELKYCEKIRGLEFKTESSADYIESLKKELELIKKEKEGLDSKLAGFQTGSKDLDSLFRSQRLDKNKEGLGYSDDDTVTDYSRLAPTVESSPDDAQNRNPFVTETEASPSTISPKSFIKFVKANDSPTNSKTDKAETAKKYPVKKFSTVNRKFITANRKFLTGSTKLSSADMGKKGKAGSSQNNIDDKGYWDCGCSRNMTGNISYLSDYEPFDRGYVSFGQGGWKITGKGTIKTDDDNVLLRTTRQHNMYSIDLNNIVPHKDLTCLVAKASADECMLWHRRLGKQHKASCKSKLVNSVSKPLHTLHMDLFGPTSVDPSHSPDLTSAFFGVRDDSDGQIKRLHGNLRGYPCEVLADNRIRGFGQLGKGQLHMGRSGRGHGYYSGGGEVHRKGWHLIFIRQRKLRRQNNTFSVCKENTVLLVTHL